MHSSWFLRFISESPSLYKAAQWFNRNVLYKLGIRIAAVDSLVIDHRLPHRLLYLERLLRLVKDVPGDIVECGVAEGMSLVIFAILNKHFSTKRHIWGFDSFEGLPTPSREDLSGPKAISRKGMFRQAYEARVLSNIRDAGFDEHAVREQVTIIKGWFSDTLPKYDGSIALLHLDADLYDSTNCALENLWPKVTIGGIAAFDEYHETEEWPGEKKAVDEYFSWHIENKNAKMYRDPFYNHYYIVKLR